MAPLIVCISRVLLLLRHKNGDARARRIALMVPLIFLQLLLCVITAVVMKKTSTHLMFREIDDNVFELEDEAERRAIVHSKLLRDFRELAAQFNQITGSMNERTWKLPPNCKTMNVEVYNTKQDIPITVSEGLGLLQNATLNMLLHLREKNIHFPMLLFYKNLGYGNGRVGKKRLVVVPIGVGFLISTFGKPTIDNIYKLNLIKRTAKKHVELHEKLID